LINTTVGGATVRIGNPEAWPREPFVGRRDELASLVALLHGTRDKTRSALIAGEAGMGKTRLVAEFLDWARENGAQVLQGHCYETQEIQPYFPILQVIDQLRLGRSEPQTLLLDLAGETPPTQGLLSGPEGLVVETQLRRTAFLRALCDTILSTTTSGVTVLCIEDVQWADEGSLLLVNYLLDLQIPDLLVICTVRPDDAGAASARQLLGRLDEKSSVIRLRGLNLPELKELTRTCTAPGEITDEEVRALHEFTGGIPLLARELLVLLREGELLRRYTLPEALKHSHTPSRVSFVLDLRLDSLETCTAETLAVASTIGAEFSAELLAQALGADVGRVEDDLALAAAKGIVEVVDALAAQRYRFSHPLYRMRLYERLLPSEQRKLHRCVADAASSSGCLSIEIAYHYAQGFGVQRSKQAVAYCQKAAEEAEAVLAYETAARFWRLALTCTRPQSARTRAELYRRLGWAFWAASKWKEAVEAWSAAIELLEGLGDWSQIETLALALGETHRLRAEDVPAERWLTRALDTPPAKAAHRARALALLASIHSLRRNSDQAAPLLEEASRLVADDHSDPVVLFWLSYSFMATGQRTKAYALAKRGLREAQRRGANGSVAMLAGNLVLQELGQLRFKTASSYARVVDRSVEPGNATALHRSLSCRAWLLAYAGEWRALADFSTEWMAEARFAGDFQVATARMFLGEAKLALGDLTGARTEMSEALPHLDQMAPICAMSLARVLLMEGDERAARQLVRRYAGRLLRDRRAMAASGRAVLGDVCSDLDEPKLWATCYRALAKEEWPLVLAYEPVSVQRVLGRLASRLKNWDGAKEHFSTAILQLDKGGANWELARSYADAAVMLRVRRRRGDLDKATSLEEQAQAILHGVKVIRADAQAGVSANGRSRYVLTGRQLEILELAAKGCNNPQIAAALTLSERTVGRHMENIFQRLNARSRTEAVGKAIAEHLLQPPRREPHFSAL